MRSKRAKGGKSQSEQESELPLQPHSKGQKRQRESWGESPQCWKPGFRRGPFLTLQASVNKWLYDISPKPVHFWEGKRVLLTIKLDNRHKSRLSQWPPYLRGHRGRRPRDCQESWWKNKKHWLNAKALGKTDTLTCTALVIQWVFFLASPSLIHSTIIYWQPTIKPTATGVVRSDGREFPQVSVTHMVLCNPDDSPKLGLYGMPRLPRATSPRATHFPRHPHPRTEQGGPKGLATSAHHGITVICHFSPRAPGFVSLLRSFTSASVQCAFLYFLPQL